jgi:predicted TIM-barrel fold metal-dependent hydrolase
VARFPRRFAYIARFDPYDPEIDDLMAQVRKAAGRICIRIASGFDFKIMRQGGHERILAAAGKHGVPVMIYPEGEYPALTNYVSKFDSVQFIIDHVGMGVERARLYRTSWRQLSTSLSPVQNTPTWRSNEGMPPGSLVNLFRIAT